MRVHRFGGRVVEVGMESEPVGSAKVTVAVAAASHAHKSGGSVVDVVEAEPAVNA